MPGRTPPGTLQTVGRASRVAVAQDVTTLIIPRKGLELPTRLPFEKWFSIGRQLSSLTASVAWCLGDWLAYGEAAFTGRYREAIKQTSLDYQTLRNYAWVAKRFPLSRRRDSLSFAHHAEVAALPQPAQDFWLRKAEEGSWSRNRLRAEVRASLSERGMPHSPSPGLGGPAGHNTAIDHGGLILEVRITAEEMHRCQAAATSHGLTLEEWILRTLEDAARGSPRH